MCEEPAPEFTLLRRLGCKADVTAFTGYDAITSIFPNQTGNAEAGTGTEDDAGGFSNGLSRMQCLDVCRIDD